MRAPYRVECLDAAGVSAHVRAWTDLLARGLEPSVFNEPAFALPATRFIPTRRRPRFLLVWDRAGPDRLLGLCCVSVPRVACPVSAWLHPQATAAFPLLDATAAEPVLEAILAWTEHFWLRPAGLLFYGIPADGPTARLVSATRAWRRTDIERRSRAVLRGPHDVRVPQGKTGKEFRRQARRLREQGAVTVKVAATAEAVAAETEHFLQLEAAGWKGRRGTALLKAPGLATFVRAMMSGLAVLDDCRVIRLDLAGRPLAIGILLRSRGRAYYWKTAYDEAFVRFSPGVHLTDAIGRSQTWEGNIDVMDSCAIPDHAMIDRLWLGRLIVIDLVIVPPGVRPGLWLALQAIILGRAVRRSAKQRLTAWRRHRSSPSPFPHS